MYVQKSRVVKVWNCQRRSEQQGIRQEKKKGRSRGEREPGFYEGFTRESRGAVRPLLLESGGCVHSTLVRSDGLTMSPPYAELMHRQMTSLPRSR